MTVTITDYFDIKSTAQEMRTELERQAAEIDGNTAGFRYEVVEEFTQRLIDSRPGVSSRHFRAELDIDMTNGTERDTPN